MTTTPLPIPSPAPAPPPGTTRNAGRAGLFALACRTELVATGRSTEFMVGAVAIPIILFALIGLPSARNLLPGGTPVGHLTMVSWAAYGVVSLAIFAFGEYLAKERARGWTRTLSATPLPAWVHLGAKLAMGVVYALLVVVGVGVVGATAGGVELTVGDWVGFATTLVAGVVAFSTLGFAIAYLVPPRAATVTANLLFLPLSFASGFFIPLSELPSFLRTLAPFLPTYHLGQLGWQQVAPADDIEALVGIAPQAALVHLAWVVGAAVLFGALALWAARREAVTRRG